MSPCPHGRQLDEHCLPCQLARVANPDGAAPNTEAEFRRLREQLAAAETLLALPETTLMAMRAHDFNLESIGMAYCWVPPKEFVQREAEWQAQLSAATATLRATIEALDPARTRAQERARCRAIVWRHMADNVTGYAVLAEIDADV